MTHDEISEFAEMLQDVCDQDGGVGICRCPLGALLRSRGWSVYGRADAFPGALAVSRLVPELSLVEANDFNWGFDGGSKQAPLAQLGALFRQQYPARYEELGR